MAFLLHSLCVIQKLLCDLFVFLWWSSCVPFGFVWVSLVLILPFLYLPLVWIRFLSLSSLSFPFVFQLYLFSCFYCHSFEISFCIFLEFLFCSGCIPVVFFLFSFWFVSLGVLLFSSYLPPSFFLFFSYASFLFILGLLHFKKEFMFNISLLSL